MKKRIITAIVIIFIVCAMAVPASAAYFYTFGPYQSSTYEVSDTCNLYSYTSYTYCDDHSYYLRSDVKTYSVGTCTDKYGNTYECEIMMQSTPGTSTRVASSNSGQTGYLISRIECDHYVNGSFVYRSYVDAG